MQKNKGFTLIELIIVLVIMSIIASIAAPKFSTMQENRQVQKTVRDLASVLTIARSNSAIYRKPITVHLKKMVNLIVRTFTGIVIMKTEIKFYTAECKDKVLKEKRKFRNYRI